MTSVVRLVKTSNSELKGAGWLLLLECENFHACESETVECRRLCLNVELEILKVGNAPIMLPWTPRDLAHERPEWVEKYDSKLNIEH
jgi:hypothetical protein